MSPLNKLARRGSDADGGTASEPATPSRGWGKAPGDAAGCVTPALAAQLAACSVAAGTRPC
jgi:hypothetical protein